MFVSKRESCSEPSKLKNELNLLKTSSSDDPASGVLHKGGDLVRLIYCGHFSILA